MFHDEMRPLPVLPPHPSVYLSSSDALTEYLRERGIAYFRQTYGLSIDIDIGEIADFTIDVRWFAQEVRFIAYTDLNPAKDKLADLALAVQEVNEEIGFPVWRVLPFVSATYTATLDHNGALSSRVFE